MLHARFRAAAAALALAALVAGCAGPAAQPTDGPSNRPASSAQSAGASSSASPEPSASPDPTALEEPAVIDSTTWLDFATEDGSIAFRYPADWTLDARSERIAPDEGRADVEPWERWMDSATLTAPNGQQLLQMHDFIDIGGACGGSVHPLEVLASEPSAAPGLASGSSVIATVALGTADGRWRVGVGITGEEWTDHQEGCAVYFVFGSSDGGIGMGTHFQMSSGGEDELWTVESLDDARAYMETAEHATIVEVLRSVEVAP